MASLAKRLARSFDYAFQGLAVLLHTQPSFRVHLAVATAVVVLTVAFRPSTVELAVLALTMGVVLAAEAFNTALEAVCDLVSPGFHPQIKLAKDVTAAGVLITALAALAVGLAVFGPRVVAAISAQ